MHANTSKLFKKYAKEYFQPNTRVLEVGPGASPPKFSELWEILPFDGKRRELILLIPSPMWEVNILTQSSPTWLTLSSRPT